MKGDERVTARATTKEPRGENRMNRSERRYHAHLQAELAAGRITWFAREPIVLRLAENLRYLPDFLVVTADGYLECHEVKGAGGQNFNARAWKHPHPDGIVKLKMADELFPFKFWLVWPEKGGGWGRRPMGMNRAEKGVEP
jgi:hypothetical protein